MAQAKWFRRLRGAAFATLAAGTLLAANAGVGAAGPAPAHGAVNYGVTRQVIVGFGASGAFGMAQAIENLPTIEQQRVLNWLFSTRWGAGLTVVRNLVNDGLDGQTIEPSPNQWNWNLLPDDQIWLMQQAEQFGVHTFISSAWSPPAWMKANASVTGGPNDTKNYLLPKYYHAYAVYLAQYVLGYWKHFHLRIYAISPQNEPNEDVTYASCVWTPQQLDTFMRNDMIPVFRQMHVPAKIILGEQAWWGDQYALPTLQDPKAAPYIPIVAAHGYGNLPIVPFPLALNQGKQIWMTEDSLFNAEDPSIQNGIYWADTINQYLSVADVSEWNFWWLVTNSGAADGLVNLSATGQAIANKRLFTLGNFSRFIRPGFHRVVTSTNPGPGLQFSAYRNPKGNEAVVVVINANQKARTMDVTLSHFPTLTGTVTPWITSAQYNLHQEAALKMTGGAFSATLPGESVTTFIVRP
jgi:glucuronoarabinoxylan endo-1,4-beta-xylanase